MWIAQISPSSLNLGVKSGQQGPSQLWPYPLPVREKNGVVTILEPIYKDLNLLQPFITIIIGIKLKQNSPLYINV